MDDHFLPDEVYTSQTPAYYRSLSALVHEYRKLVERTLPPGQLARLSPSCSCVECLWALGEVEDVLHDRS